MTFKATIKEIGNGFLVELNPKPFEYEEVYVPTFDRSTAVVTAKYAQWHPSGPLS